MSGFAWCFVTRSFSVSGHHGPNLAEIDGATYLAPAMFSYLLERRLNVG